MTTKLLKWAIGICLVNFLHFSATFACRYTVREIGFTDLASSPYHIYFYSSNEISKDKEETLRKISYAALLDANVELEIVNVDKQKDHPAMEYFNFWKNSKPAAVLVSPEGQSMVLPLNTKDESFKQSIWVTLESIVSSPTQRRIAKSIVKSYGVVIFIEGKDALKNKTAKENVLRAIKEITQTMNQMPKPVNDPPLFFEIKRQSVAEEKILLWSLGISEEIGNEPIAAILYGRGRRMGPPVKGELITERIVYNLLSIVGADCECGLDRSWMLGMMIPLRWDSDAQVEVIKQLGFDAENPMVKAEMSQILSISPSSNSAQSFGRGEENLFGYREGKIELNKTESVPRLSLPNLQEMNTSNSFGLNTSLIIIGGILMLILIVGAFIFIQSKRRNEE